MLEGTTVQRPVPARPAETSGKWPLTLIAIHSIQVSHPKLQFTKVSLE